MIRATLLALLGMAGATVASAQGLPAPLAARLAENPGAVLQQAEEMILGHGTGGGIDRDGIARMVAINRAAARARATGQLLAADLDGDGAVTADEAAVTAAARSADARGRFLRQVAAADADADGRIAPAELRAMAEAQALRSVSRAREARMTDLLALDGNGDGTLTLDEVRAAADAAQAARPATGSNGATPDRGA